MEDQHDTTRRTYALPPQNVRQKALEIAWQSGCGQGRADGLVKAADAIARYIEAGTVSSLANAEQTKILSTYGDAPANRREVMLTIMFERAQQVRRGYTEADDDGATDAQLIDNAISRLADAALQDLDDVEFIDRRLKSLTQAAALVIAEMERVYRKAIAAREHRRSLAEAAKSHASVAASKAADAAAGGAGLANTAKAAATTNGAATHVPAPHVPSIDSVMAHVAAGASVPSSQGDHADATSILSRRVERIAVGDDHRPIQRQTFAPMAGQEARQGDDTPAKPHMTVKELDVSVSRSFDEGMDDSRTHGADSAVNDSPA